MKKVFLSIVALAALVALPMSVSAQLGTTAGDNTAELSIPGHARILSALTLANTSTGGAGGLEFGTLFISGTAGNAADTVSILPSSASTRRIGGTAVVGGVDGYTPAAATFTVTGEANASYTLVVPGSVTLNGSNTNSAGTKTLAVTLYPSKNGSTTLSAATETITVGGKFAVAADQSVGDYTGSFTVTATYN